MNYTQLPSYSKILKEGWVENTGPRQRKAGTVQFDQVISMKSNENVYLYWPDNGQVAKRKATSSMTLTILETGIDLDLYDQAFNIILDSISKIKNEKNVNWFDQLSMNKHKVILYLFSKLKPATWDEKVYKDLDPLKRIHAIMKTWGYLEKGRDY